jgi:hypothetical protein
VLCLVLVAVSVSCMYHDGVMDNDDLVTSNQYIEERTVANRL